MTYGGFGGSLFLIAVGAILRYAITWDPENVDVATVGLILLLAGVVLLLVTVLFAFTAPRGPGAGPPRL
ncbi:MAG TPA: DUF6458 family protein [Longimicrobiales bacterium]|nr:DUF6458 family protein [Longimicrobiales bacterium]